MLFAYKQIYHQHPVVPSILMAMADGPEKEDEESESLSDLEEKFEKKHIEDGYKTGYELGKKAGQEDGYSQGLIEGAKVGSEVGLYKGHTMTWIQLLKQQESRQSNRALSKFNEVFDLVDKFPSTNNTQDKLSEVRIKYKQANRLLNECTNKH